MDLYLVSWNGSSLHCFCYYRIFYDGDGEWTKIRADFFFRVAVSAWRERSAPDMLKSEMISILLFCSLGSTRSLGCSRIERKHERRPYVVSYLFTRHHDPNICCSFSCRGHDIWTPPLFSPFFCENVVSLRNSSRNARQNLSWNEEDFSKVLRSQIIDWRIFSRKVENLIRRQIIYFAAASSKI